jgi:hypothetical protein
MYSRFPRKYPVRPAPPLYPPVVWPRRALPSGRITRADYLRLRKRVELWLRLERLSRKGKFRPFQDNSPKLRLLRHRLRRP